MSPVPPLVDFLLVVVGVRRYAMMADMHPPPNSSPPTALVKRPSLPTALGCVVGWTLS